MILSAFTRTFFPRLIVASTPTAEEIYERNKLRELQKVADSGSELPLNLDSGDFLVVMLLLVGGLVAIRRLVVD